MKKSQAVSFRITEEAKTLLVKLAEKYGISQADMLEILIRERAKKDEQKPNRRV